MSSSTFDTPPKPSHPSKSNQRELIEVDLCTALTRSCTWNKTSHCRVEMAGFAYALNNNPLLITAPKITSDRATMVTRKTIVHGKVKAATKVVQTASTASKSLLTHLTLPVATRLPVIQPCCVPPVEMRPISLQSQRW